MAKNLVKIRLAAIAVMLVFFLGGFEVLLRFAAPIPVTGIQYAPCNLVPSKEFGALYIPNSTDQFMRLNEIDLKFHVNNLGFHDADRQIEKRAAFRIVVVGDSFTASRQVEISKTWTQKLELILKNRLNKPLEVINLGLSGTGTVIHQKLLQRFSSLLKPDLIIYQYTVGNQQDDMYPNIIKECYRNFFMVYQNNEARQKILTRVREIHRNAWWGFIVKHSYVARAVNYYFDWWPLTNIFRQDSFGYKWTVEKSPIPVEKVLRNMQNNALSEGSQFVILPIPIKGLGSSSEPIAIDSYEDIEIAAKLTGIKLIDIRKELITTAMTKGVSTRSYFWKYDGHYNEAGNSALAAAIAEKLINIDIIK